MSVQSVQIARERLKNLLVSDRVQCTPDAVERLTKELYQTVSKYMEVEPGKIEIQITRTDIHIKYMGQLCIWMPFVMRSREFFAPRTAIPTRSRASVRCLSISARLSSSL